MQGGIFNAFIDKQIHSSGFEKGPAEMLDVTPDEVVVQLSHKYKSIETFFYKQISAHLIW